MSNTSSFSLLQFKERLNFNLAGNQIASLLDKLLYAALKPIFLYTEWIHYSLAELINCAQNDHRRKTSLLEKNQLINKTFLALTALDRKEGWKSLKGCMYQRIIWSQCIKSFLIFVQDYKEMHLTYIRTENKALAKKLLKIEKFLNVSRTRLYSIINWVEECFRMYNEFKSMITEKYIRLAYNEAKKASRTTTLHIDADDLFKNFLLAVDQAIEKYSPEKGALTSWIKWWFFNSLSNPKFSHIYGQSYKISATHRRNLTNKLKDGESITSTFSESIEDHLEHDCETDSIEKTIVSESGNLFWSEILMQMAKHSPEVKIPLLLFGIPLKLDSKLAQ